VVANDSDGYDVRRLGLRLSRDTANGGSPGVRALSECMRKGRPEVDRQRFQEPVHTRKRGNDHNGCNGCNGCTRRSFGFAPVRSLPSKSLQTRRFSEPEQTDANARQPLPCRRSWVRVPSSAPKTPVNRGFLFWVETT
jgi:hypothetical protein